MDKNDIEFELDNWETGKDVVRIFDGEIQFATVDDINTPFPYDSWTYSLTIDYLEKALKFYYDYHDELSEIEDYKSLLRLVYKQPISQEMVTKVLKKWEEK